MATAGGSETPYDQTVPLLEREGPLAILTGLLDEATSQAGRLVFVEGEAGIGKSSLLGRFREVVPAATRFAVGTCDPLSTPHPLGPLIDVVAGIGGATERLLGEGADRDRVFRAFLAELTAGPGPMVVAFEDVHWADEATLDLLRFLGRRIESSRSLLIVTYRDDEVGRMHPLRVVVGDLGTSPAVRRLPLGRLSEESVEVLARSSRVDPLELHRLTGGNPFFVTEVLEAAPGGIPATVRDAVLARAARLSPAGRRTLEAAAVIGAIAERWLLQAALDEEAQTDECVARGVLLAKGDAYAFRHEIARDTILDSIDPASRAALNTRILAALRTLPDPERPIARMAHHAEEAGDGAAVLEFAPEAGRRAASLGSHREAAGQFARAVRFADLLPPSERGDLLEAYAAEHSVTDRTDLARDALEDAVATWRAEGDRRREGAALSQLAMSLVAGGRNADADAAAEGAIDLLEPLPDGPEKVDAYAIRAYLYMLDRQSGEAIAAGRRAIEAGRAVEGAAGSVVRAYNTVGSARILLGDDGGRDDLEESLRLALEAGNHRGVAVAYSNLGSAFGEMYHFADADRYLAAGIAYATEHDNDISRFYTEAWQALSHLHQGRWSEAAESASRVLVRPNVATWSRIMASLAVGRLRARRGDPDAWAALDEALALSEQTGTLQRLGPVRAARAEAAWLAGDQTRAALEASAVLPLAIKHRHPWHMGELNYWLAKSGEPIVETDGLAAPYALQLAGRSAEAARAWEALNCPYEAARALLDGDDIAAIQGAHATFDRLGARPAAAIAARRLRELGAPSIPRGRRPATRGNPAGLTPRELEILRLVAGGLRNDEIATRLFLSTRTVDHHVSAVLAKLGVERRTDVATAAARLGIDPQIGQSVRPD